MMGTPAPEVFVSYASRDRQRVADVVGQLRAHGVQVWWDQQALPGGRTYGPEILRGIRTCKVLLLVCTDASFRSRNVKQEIQLAWRYQRPYLPLLAERVDEYPEQVQYWLEGWQWIDIVDIPPERWLPSVLYSLSLSGVSCDVPRHEAVMPVVAAKAAPEGIEGLRALARMSDQIWPVPADYARRLGLAALRDLGAPQDAAIRRVSLGSRVCLAIESERPGHVLLLDIGSSGTVYCLCPSHFAPDTWVEAGRTYLPSGRSAHESFIVTGNPGREHLVAIFSNAPLDFDWMPADSTTPARTLTAADITHLITRLQELAGDSWWAISTYFDVR